MRNCGTVRVESLKEIQKIKIYKKRLRLENLPKLPLIQTFANRY